MVVLEFTANEPSSEPVASPPRRGYERLIRKLLRLPGRPAVLLLHHYPWWVPCCAAPCCAAPCYAALPSGARSAGRPGCQCPCSVAPV